MNRVSHFEIQAGDINRAMQFYKALFGWNIYQFPGMEYWAVETAPKDSKEAGINGGLLKRPCDAPEIGQGTNAFVCTVVVEDLDAMMKKALELGGRVAMEKFDIAGMAWQAYFIDTEGNTVGLHELKK